MVRLRGPPSAVNPFTDRFTVRDMTFPTKGADSTPFCHAHLPSAALRGINADVLTHAGLAGALALLACVREVDDRSVWRHLVRTRSRTFLDTIGAW